MIDINPDRLLTHLRALAKFGADDHGVNRLAFSKADASARLWVSERLEEAGLHASIDRLGNVYGRNRTSARTVLVGSHTDSVPNGGWLDGALGVVYGLEIAFALRDRPRQRPVGIDVIDFEDEEGTISPFLGSRAFCGELSDSSAIAMVPSQTTIDRTSGAALIHHYERDRHLAFLEAHIEQGPKLEAAGCTIGVVRGITGIRRFRALASGQADHAGTTPMNMRRDAARALFELMEHVYRELPRVAGRDSVWNIGDFSIRPGAANVVPQRAEMLIECRDLDEAVLDNLESSMLARVRTCNAAGGVQIEIERTYCTSPVPMAKDIVQLFEGAARRLQQRSLTLASGAGHDAMIMAGVMPAGMMFIPSIGGRSHSGAEDSKEDDIVSGCRVFAAAVDELISARSNAG
jgi:N-carbamoyl-L-amino-acid hydrolase